MRPSDDICLLKLEHHAVAEAGGAASARCVVAFADVAVWLADDRHRDVMLSLVALDHDERVLAPSRGCL